MKELNFLRWRWLCLMFSGVLLAVSLVSLTFSGLSYGLDFTGGISVELEFPEKADLPAVRNALAVSELPPSTVGYFGTEHLVVVRLPFPEEKDVDVAGSLLNALTAAGIHGVQVRQSAAVGPRIGEELREQGGLAVLVALLGILMYIAFRFQSKFAAAAVAALLHDVLLVLGIFSLFGLDFDLSVLAAIFALIGYSLNDTIVVCDRIREMFRSLRGRDAVSVINISLTRTLTRTLVTSLTTLLVLLCLLLLGGGALRGFSLALFLGVIVGTYSSIYIASSVLLWLKITSADLVVPEREAEEG